MIIEDDKMVLYIEEDYIITELFPNVLWRYIILEYLENEEIEEMSRYTKEMEKLCFEILNKRSQLFFNHKKADYNALKAYNDYIEENEGELINLTRAKEYINQKNLNKLEYIRKQNPYYKSGPEMKLYDIREVIRECIKENKGWNNYIKKQENKKEQKTKRIIKKDSKKIERKKEIIEELKKYKMELRDDSMLCKMYIEGVKMKYSLNEIVDIMCLMKYWFEYVDVSIRNRLNNDRRRDQRELEECWDLDDAHEMYHEKWKRREFHEIILDYIKKPNEWPWMKRG